MKELLRKIVPNVVRKYYSGRMFLSKNPEQVFTQIYEKRVWNKGGGSVSGSGSDQKQTELISAKLPDFFRQYEIRSILDIPCGDFNWMQHVISDDLELQYLGADIVQDLVDANNEAHGSQTISFQKLNLIEDRLPKVDLIFCRDCLVHLSYEDIQKSIDNVVASDSKYFLATTFVNRTKNRDIITGNHRQLNMTLPPFNFPEPVDVINEQEPDSNNHFSDKCLGLWKIEDLAKLR